MNRRKFSQENIDIINKVMLKNTTQQNKYYELEQLGFSLFDGALGGRQRDCGYIHKDKKNGVIKVQLESGYGHSNYARYVYFSE